jgi:hypothetical protein
MRTAMAASPEPLTINGIHLNETGDRVFAGILMTALGFEPAPSDTSATALKAFDALREQVRAKNQLWFYRFRPLNAEYVVGRRVNPFGSVNFPGEMKRLDEADRRAGSADLAPGADHREGRGAMIGRAATRAVLALALAGAASGVVTGLVTSVVSAQAPRKEPNLGGDLDLASQDPDVAAGAAQTGGRLRGIAVRLGARVPGAGQAAGDDVRHARTAVGAGPRPRIRTWVRTRRRTTS